MRSPAQAIVWEICAKNRWALLLAFGLIPFLGLIEAIVPPGHEIIAMWQTLAALTTFFSIIWVCSYTANDSRGRFSGFPAWMYTLPMRTSALVLCPMLLGIVLMLVAVPAWELTILAYWRRPVEGVKITWHALLCVGTLVSVQSIVWSLHRFRWLRIVALVAAIYGFFYVALVGPLWNFPGGTALWFGGVLLALALAMGGGIAGVERDRHGGWQGWTGRLLEYLLDLMPRRSGAFASAARAQLWLEWRRKGLLLTTLLGSTMALCLFSYPLSAALYLGSVETLLNFSGPFIAMIFVAGIAGNAIAKSDLWSPELGIHPVIAIRPLGASAMVFAKMKAALAVTLLAWILFSILLIPVFNLWRCATWPSEESLRFWQDFPTNYPRFWQWLTNPLVMVGLIAATWHTMMQTMAVMLTGDKRHILLSMWKGIIVLLAIGACTVWLFKDRSKFEAFLRFLPWFTTAMMLLKAWGAVRGFVAAKALVSGRDFVILLGLWALVALLVLAAGTVAHLCYGLPPAILWLLVLWQFFPSGEIPQCVVALTQNRHR